MKKTKFNISLINSNKTKKSNKRYKWTGTGKDMLFGLVYLKKKYKDVCLPLLSFFSSDLMLDTAIRYECSLNKNKSEANHKDYKLYFPTNNSNKKNELSSKDFIEKLKYCRNNKKRFSLIPIYLMLNNCDYSEAHYNYLIFDNKKNIVERFDPYGVYNYESFETFLWFDKDFKRLLKNNKLKMTYITPEQTCLDTGVQAQEEKDISRGKASVRKNDFGGYCGPWSIYYSDLRLKYPDIEPDILQRIILKKLKKNPKTLRQFIRDYSTKLKKYKYNVLREINESCKDVSKDRFASINCFQEFKELKLYKLLK